MTGNLMRAGLTTPHPPTPPWLTLHTDKPLLYITGGNQGSEIINTTISQAIGELTRTFSVIHQCGNPTAQRNYQSELERVRMKLSPAKQKRYAIRPWISEKELAWIYQHTHSVVSRAGANTLQELQYFCIPSVLIPLPFSHYDEQAVGAAALEKAGGAVVLAQSGLNPRSLIAALKKVVTAHTKMRQSLQRSKKKLPYNSAQTLYKTIQTVLPATKVPHEAK
ncbi:MAG: hypothetical protein H6774_03500 [Pseudomonadales bacterium]|nr:hypothetical protein [Pseudomonadales bacterium]